MLRLEIGPQFQYELYFDQKKAGDLEASSNGVTVLFDKNSAKKANGMCIAWERVDD
jgi:Fe-S cluster assembly iron-binding protein IscA